MKNKTSIGKMILAWSLVFIWAGLIFWASSVDFTNGNPNPGSSDLMPNIAHIVEYFVLAVLLTLALLSSGVNKRRAIVIAFLFSIIYGITDEGHQYYTPNREPSFSDWLIDATASFLVLSLFSLKWKIKPKKKATQ